LVARCGLPVIPTGRSKTMIKTMTLFEIVAVFGPKADGS
jgi:hypothetical protein